MLFSITHSTKAKAPEQPLGYCSTMLYLHTVALATRFSLMQNNYVRVCNQAYNLVIHMSEADVKI